MSETTNTAGPWYADLASEATDWPADQIYIFDHTHGCVAEVDCHTNWATTMANARLIAAAPDLLAACREMAADLVKHATLGLNESEVAMLRRAESAIAKAEGRE